ncbi:hypothetical protein N8E89_22470 (plasmid) [Phyllobacterium sp. A18/5-2]|uniref:hypothetical protein n=1 Tax=Phyllobacterium sp. A18/5-2 TaxID=2978392 RepID=UPI0021C820C9|nr:hypothetical protein [Phyllobacterium sp. A18/5-2]UXN66013.1 hypothetical protein N8E89_22470 [Phyllobacterium sp. A18/5-2]
MSRDTDLLHAIQTYFDALYACDLSLFDQIFIQPAACSTLTKAQSRWTRSRTIAK